MVVKLSYGTFDVYLPTGMPKSMTVFSDYMHPFWRLCDYKARDVWRTGETDMQGIFINFCM